MVRNPLLLSSSGDKEASHPLLSRLIPKAYSFVIFFVFPKCSFVSLEEDPCTPRDGSPLAPFPNLVHSHLRIPPDESILLPKVAPWRSSPIVGKTGVHDRHPRPLQRLLRLKQMRRLRTTFEAFNMPDSRGIVETILRKRPVLVNMDAELTVMPKLEFLHSLGFQGHGLAKIVASNPQILEIDLNSKLVPLLSFLKGVVPAELSADLLAFFCNTMDLPKFKPSNCLSNVEVLRKHGISRNVILMIISCKVSGINVAPRRLDRVIKIAEGIGFDRNSITFARAVGIFAHVTDKMVAQKIRLFESLGWKDEEIFNVVYNRPQVLEYSCGAIKKKVTFFKEVLNWDSSLMSKEFSLMGCSIEKQIKARGAVLNLLMLKGQIPRYTGPRRFRVSQKIFLRRYVERYDNKVVGVVEAYEGRVFEGWEHGCPEKAWVKF